MFVNILNDTPTSLCMFVQLVHVYISIDISLTKSLCQCAYSAVNHKSMNLHI